MGKGDGDAATWLPPNKPARCAYVARQVAVKTAYALWVTPAEQQATQRVLTGCPGQTLPTEAATTPPAVDPGTPALAVPTAAATPSPAPRSASPNPRPKTTHHPSPPPPPTATPPGGGELDPRFATCKAAIAAGYGPYTEGVDPKYDWYRDADGDGVDCEHR